MTHFEYDPVFGASKPLGSREELGFLYERTHGFCRVYGETLDLVFDPPLKLSQLS